MKDYDTSTCIDSLTGKKGHRYYKENLTEDYLIDPYFRYAVHLRNGETVYANVYYGEFPQKG